MKRDPVRVGETTFLVIVTDSGNFALHRTHANHSGYWEIEEDPGESEGELLILSDEEMNEIVSAYRQRSESEE